MNAPTLHDEPSDNPLLAGDAGAWERLLDAVGPASMLVAIRARMGRALLARTSPEDVWQETLLCAWNERRRFEWRGLRSFRRWLIQIAENRVRDGADALDAAKRGGGASTTPLELGSAGGGDPMPAGSTTPSRIATYREQADAMERALSGLDDGEREVVRLRLFEELEMTEVAAKCNIGVSAAKHRFRKGAQKYRKLLAAALHSGSSIAERSGPA